MEYPEFQTGIFGRMESAPKDYRGHTQHYSINSVYGLMQLPESV